MRWSCASPSRRSIRRIAIDLSARTASCARFATGFRILRTIVLLVKEERPLLFFSTVGSLLVDIATAIAAPLLRTYLATGLVPRFPTAILATGLMILAFMSFVTGLCSTR